jgi:hypothetical protein
MPKIDVLYAYISVDKDENDEGVIAIISQGQLVPLIGADLKRMESYRPYAEILSKKNGKKIRFVKFEKRTEISVMEPPIEIPVT